MTSLRLKNYGFLGNSKIHNNISQTFSLRRTRSVKKYIFTSCKDYMSSISLMVQLRCFLGTRCQVNSSRDNNYIRFFRAIFTKYKFGKTRKEIILHESNSCLIIRKIIKKLLSNFTIVNSESIDKNTPPFFTQTTTLPVWYQKN